MNEPTNDLEKYFHTMAKRGIQKWSNYFDIYDMHFSRFRGEAVNVLEIGISKGGSLQMWKWYFGSKAKIFGIDNDPSTIYKEARIKTFQCDQGDKEAMAEVMVVLPTIDIVIDDGGHTMDQQLNTFDVLYPFVSENGIYLCEDIQTSFFEEYGGGIDRRRTFLGIMKKHVDQLSAIHSRGQIPMTDYALSANSMHFYSGVVVIEKGAFVEPQKVAARVKKEEG